MPTDVLSKTAPVADHRIKYGKNELQFGDLRLPKVTAAHLAPVVVWIHGGWWKATYDLEYGGHLCAALKADGMQHGPLSIAASGIQAAAGEAPSKTLPQPTTFCRHWRSNTHLI